MADFTAELEPTHRRVSRILLLDEDDRFLLMLTSSPRLLVPVVRWITPGGGVEEGESHAEAAIRELFEETGLVVSDIGEPTFAIDGVSTFATGQRQTTHSEFYVVRTQAFSPVTDHWMPNEFVDITQVRWWTLPELKATTEPYSPEPLIGLIEAALS